MRAIPRISVTWWFIVLVLLLVFPLIPGMAQDAEDAPDEEQAVVTTEEANVGEPSVAGEEPIDTGLLDEIVIEEGAIPVDEVITEPVMGEEFNFQIPDGFRVTDRANDDGGAFAIRWNPSPDDSVVVGTDEETGEDILSPGAQYMVFHSDQGPDGPWEAVTAFPSDTTYIWEDPVYFGFFLSDTSRGSNEHYAFYEMTYPEFGVYSYTIQTFGMSIFDGLDSLTDFDYIVTLSSGETVDWWVEAGRAAGVPVGLCCPGDLAGRYESYYMDGRLDGLLAGKDILEDYEFLMALGTKGAEIPPGTTFEAVSLFWIMDGIENPEQVLAEYLQLAEESPEEVVLDEDAPEELVRMVEFFNVNRPAEGIIADFRDLVIMAENLDPRIKSLYYSIEGLSDLQVADEENNFRILFAFDYGPDTNAEMRQLAHGMMTHVLNRELDIVALSLIPEGPDMITRAFETSQNVNEVTYGERFVDLGYQEGGPAVLTEMGQNLRAVCPVDYRGTVTDPSKLFLYLRAYVYDPGVTDYGSLTVMANLKPFGGEKVELAYALPYEGEQRREWENPFESVIEFDTSGESTTTSKFILFTAPVRGQDKGVLEAQPTEGSIGADGEPIILINSDGDEGDIPDNRDEHWFRAYALPLSYNLPVDEDLLPGELRFYASEELPPDEYMIGASDAVIAVGNIWNGSRTNTFWWSIIFSGAVLIYIASARRGTSLYVRRIAGLDHVEEAIGRATEMGRPILYSTGLGGVSDIATIASMNILGQVARKVADYDSRLINPHRDPIVMAVCQEIVQEAYIDAGRPDAANKDDVFFITDDQFAYTAAVDGIMIREKPATNLFMGMFFAESLLLAETGASTGAIQIAGTDALAQLPFFITACDYTLIGEELYAASAYLSREPKLLGSLKGQDMAKMIFMVGIILGTLLLCTTGLDFIQQLFQVF